MLQLISLLVENKPGALMRVTGLLTARGYNIESLTVARTLDPELSRMSIVVDIEPNQRAQLIKQMNKLINVLVENKPGALMRVTGLLTARGYNIESLTVARTLDPELSRMSIVVDIESNQ